MIGFSAALLVLLTQCRAEILEPVCPSGSLRCRRTDRQTASLCAHRGFPSASCRFTQHVPPSPPSSPAAASSSCPAHVSAAPGPTYLQAPADRPLDEGQLLQLLRRPAGRSGRAQSHPAGEHLLTGTGPVALWLLLGERAAELSTIHPWREDGGGHGEGGGGCLSPFPRRSRPRRSRRHTTSGYRNKMRFKP